MILYVDENDELQRLDNFLKEILPDISRSKIQAFIKEGNILVNGGKKKSSYILRENDRIEV